MNNTSNAADELVSGKQKTLNLAGYPKALQAPRKWIRVFLFPTIIFGAISVFFGIQRIVVVSASHSNGITSAELLQQASLSSTVYMLVGYFGMLLLFFLLLIPLLIWVYRANKNLHSMKVEGLKHTPGWSVGWWFIPIANAIKPFMIFDELWRASKVPTENWKKQPNSNLAVLLGVIVWFIAGVSRIDAEKFVTEPISILQMETVLIMIVAVGFIAGLIVQWLLVTKISQMQHDCITNKEIYLR